MIYEVWRKTQSIFDSGKRRNTSKSDRIKKEGQPTGCPLLFESPEKIS
jgi:hypothetical protein